MDTRSDTTGYRRPERVQRHGGFVGPIIMIGLGVIFLLDNLHWLWWFRFDVMWPALLILIGLLLIGVFWVTQHHEHTPAIALVGILVALVMMLVARYLVLTRGIQYPPRPMSAVSSTQRIVDQTRKGIRRAARSVIAPSRGEMTIDVPSRSSAGS